MPQGHVPEDDDWNHAAVRARIHKLADTVHRQGVTLAEHQVLHAVTTEKLKNLDDKTATREQLDAFSKLVDQKFVGVEQSLAPIQRGINWAIFLIVGAVVLALLSLILKGNPDDRAAPLLHPSGRLRASTARDARDSRPASDGAADRYRAAGVTVH